jgi:hypothetical protein
MSKEIEKIQPLVGDIKTLIAESRQQVAVAVNSAMSMLYWSIGKRINDEVLQNQRAEYGKEIVVSVARQLEVEYGKGWGEKQLRQCMKLAETFPEKEIVYTLCIQLSWSHITELIYFDDDLKRMFYIELKNNEQKRFFTKTPRFLPNNYKNV